MADDVGRPYADAVAAAAELPRSIEAVDRKIEELRQTLSVTHHPSSISRLWDQIDLLLERRLLLADEGRDPVA